MYANPGAVACRWVRTRGMWRAIAKEHHPACLQLTVHGIGVVRRHANMVIAIGIFEVFVTLLIRIGYDFERAVRLGGVLDGNPHGGTFQRIADSKVRVVGVPVCRQPSGCRFQEQLIEDLHHGITQQLRGGLSDLFAKRQHPEQLAVGREGH